MKQRSTQQGINRGNNTHSRVSKQNSSTTTGYQTDSLNESYGMMLAMELLIKEFEESNSKYY